MPRHIWKIPGDFDFLGPEVSPLEFDYVVALPQHPGILYYAPVIRSDFDFEEPAADVGFENFVARPQDPGTLNYGRVHDGEFDFNGPDVSPLEFDYVVTQPQDVSTINYGRVFLGDFSSDILIVWDFFGVPFKNEKTTWNKGNRMTMLAVNDPVTIPVGGEINATDRYTANQTLTPANEIILGDTDGGAFTITLPAGVDGLHYEISNVGSTGNTLTITPNGSETIDGTAGSFALFDGETLDLTFETTEGWIA